MSNDRLNEIDLALHEIGSMVELTIRVLEEDDSFENKNLADFAIHDIERRVKELRASLSPANA